MPNWCSNCLNITGDTAKLDPLEKWVTGEKPQPAYDRAVAQSLRLLAAGVAGLRRPVGRMQDVPPLPWRFPPLPALTAHGAGDDTPENRAFTRWLRLLKCNPPLDDHYCSVINRYWQQSGLAAVQWSDMSESQQEIIRALFDKKQHDWFGYGFGKPAITVAERWQSPETRESSAGALPMDMCELIPTHLAPELNGFNGRLWEAIPDGTPSPEGWLAFQPGYSSYALYLELYGVKWPRGYDVHYERHNSNRLTVHFDSPWGPPGNAVMAALSRRFDVCLVHTFCEEGMGFCGFREYEHGELINLADDEPEYGEEDEEGLTEVTGPAYVTDNLRHNGG